MPIWYSVRRGRFDSRTRRKSYIIKFLGNNNMGIFDFLKRIANIDNVKEIVIEKLAFSEIESWIEKKIGENELKEKEILFVVGESTMKKKTPC